MLSPTKRGFSTVILKDAVKEQLDKHRGKTSASDAIAALLGGAGPAASADDFDWDGLRLALKQRLKLAGTAVLDVVLKEYGMPSE